MMTRLTYLRKVAGLPRRLLTLALILVLLAPSTGPHAGPGERPGGGTITVLEPVEPQRNFLLLKESEKHTMRDAATMRFDVDVPANGETVITYTIRYTKG